MKYFLIICMTLPNLYFRKIILVAVCRKDWIEKWHKGVRSHRRSLKYQKMWIGISPRKYSHIYVSSDWHMDNKHMKNAHHQSLGTYKSEPQCHFTPPEWLKLKVQTITSVIKDVRKLKFSYTIGGNVQLVQSPWRTVWQFITSYKIQQFYFSV